MSLYEEAIVLRTMGHGFPTIIEGGIVTIAEIAIWQTKATLKYHIVWLNEW